jgi:hypothetical protein
MVSTRVKAVKHEAADPEVDVNDINEDFDDTDYEAQRQKTIAENRALFGMLGLESASVAVSAAAKPKPAPRKATKKRAAETVLEGPRRRSGRIAGLEADGPALAARAEEEARVVEAQRVISRKLREQVMPLATMVEEDETPAELVPELEALLKDVAEKPVPRVYPAASTGAKEAYADSDTAPAEVARLKAAFSNMTLRANTKVTSERVFSMVVHPEKRKSLVLVGDKYGQLGM